MTVILSEMGWVRAGKGHEVDVAGLAYKAGDQFLAAATGRSNQQAVFLTNQGAPMRWRRILCRQPAPRVSRSPDVAV